MDVNLCDSCSTRFQAYGSVAGALGENVSDSLVVALLCGECLGACLEGKGDPAVGDLPVQPPTTGPPASTPPTHSKGSSSAYEPGPNLYL